MRKTVHFLTADTEHILLEEQTLAFGLAFGYERGAATLSTPEGGQVRVELRDENDHLLDWRTYVVSAADDETPRRLAIVV
jgi:hypothetical protein